MSWHSISVDEMEHTQMEHHRVKIAPGERAIELTRATIRKCLQTLGITNPEDMNEVADMGYSIEEVDTHQAMQICQAAKSNFNPNICGFYINKVNEAYFLAREGLQVPPATIESSLVYFISDCFIDPLGRTTLNLYDARTDKLNERQAQR